MPWGRSRQKIATRQSEMTSESERRPSDSASCMSFSEPRSLSVENKRKDTASTRAASRSKRARHNPEWRESVIEQLTPEKEVSPSPNLRTHGPFCPGQFEDGTVRMVRMGEEELVSAMVAVLEETCDENNRKNEHLLGLLSRSPPYRTEKYPDGSSSVFFSLTKPSIVLSNYLTRFVRYLNVSRSVFIVSLVYLDRVRQDDELLGLGELNIHRLVTTALCVSAKYLEDESHRNSSLSRIGGVPSTVEMNMLEHQFLRRMNWECSVSITMYARYEERLCRKLSSLQ